MSVPASKTDQNQTAAMEGLSGELAYPAGASGRDAAKTGAAPNMRSIIGGSIGNFIEYFDWFVYSSFAIYFAKYFFPHGNQTVQLLKTAGIFALGFLMRPIGGWLLGIYADRRGRKSALTLAVLLMCIGSLMIACAPGYAEIGLLSPILLILARCMQGFSLGGEYGSGTTYVVEVAEKNRRGFYSSYMAVTLSLGQLLAMLVLVVLQQFVLTKAQLNAWGWRIPFLVGAVLALVGLYVRRGMVETEAFQAAREKQPRENLLKVLFRHPRPVLTVIGLTLGGTIAFYTYSTYMQQFLVNTTGLTKAQATLISAASLFIYTIVHPLVGALSDKIGRRPILIAFGVLGLLCTYPIMITLEHTHSVWVAFFLTVFALLVVSGYTAVNMVVKVELFPAHVRALGVGLSYGLANSIFGGTAEFWALWFKHLGHETWFYWYVTACIGISLVVYICMPETRDLKHLDTAGD